MLRRILSVAFILSALAITGQAAERPNIVVIMADDMGFADAGFTGAEDIKTPNLDKLAASGVIFTQGYVNHPFCGPSRAALLSGRYQHRFGFETNPAYDPSNNILGIDPGEVLFPARLQKAGYTTACIGKWHLGAAEPFHPNNRGFDYFYGFLGGGHDYFRIDLTKPVKEGYLQALTRNDKPAVFDGYLTTALSRDAANFIKGQGDKPFFLYLAYNAPHSPQQAPEEAIKRYEHIEDRKRRVYAAMVDVMDQGIGEVLDALEQNGKRDNTLVFFLSDNGGPQSSTSQPGKWNGSSNEPLRGGKGDLYDGGVHVPFIASWPRKYSPGTTYSKPVIAIDISRTAVEIAGADTSIGPQLEGVNLVPYVTGQLSDAPHDHLFFRSGDNKWSVLAADGTKHVLENDAKAPQLFYLPADISENNNLIEKQPDRAKELYSKWVEWNAENVPCRLLGYQDYHKRRDEFYQNAIPTDAKKAGYSPKAEPNFK